jgi:hypothetical protein
MGVELGVDTWKDDMRTKLGLRHGKVIWEVSSKSLKWGFLKVRNELLSF